MTEVKCPVCKCAISLGEEIGKCIKCDTPFHKKCYKSESLIVCPTYACGGKEFVWVKFGEKAKNPPTHNWQAPIERCTGCGKVMCIDSFDNDPNYGCDCRNLPAVSQGTAPSTSVGQDFLTVIEDYEYSAEGGLTSIHKEVLQLRMQEKYGMTSEQTSILERAYKVYKNLTELIDKEIKGYARKQIPEPMPKISLGLMMLVFLTLVTGVVLYEYKMMLLWFTGNQIIFSSVVGFLISLCICFIELVILENKTSKKKKKLIGEIKPNFLEYIQEEKLEKLVEDKDYVLETYGKRFFEAGKKE